MKDEDGSIALPHGAHLAYEVRGAQHQGVPVLLLRPLAGGMALWGEFRDVIAARFRVIAYDPRGTGPSSDASVAATTRDMARDAIAVLDALGVARAHVFGISFGAMIATWLAIDAPERVDRLCLASAGPTGFELSVSGITHGAAMVASVMMHGEDAGARAAAAVLSENVREGQPARVEAIKRAANAEPSDRAELAKHAMAAARHDAREELGRIAAPTLVLAGDHDELIGQHPSIALAAAIRGAHWEAIADAGHDLTLEQPAATAKRVVEFFLNEGTSPRL